MSSPVKAVRAMTPVLPLVRTMLALPTAEDLFPSHSLLLQILSRCFCGPKTTPMKRRKKKSNCLLLTGRLESSVHIPPPQGVEHIQRYNRSEEPWTHSVPMLYTKRDAEE